MLTHTCIVHPAAALILGMRHTPPGLSDQGATCPICWELAVPRVCQAKLPVSWMDIFLEFLQLQEGRPEASGVLAPAFLGHMFSFAPQQDVLLITPVRPGTWGCGGCGGCEVSRSGVLLSAELQACRQINSSGGLGPFSWGCFYVLV